MMDCKDTFVYRYRRVGSIVEPEKGVVCGILSAITEFIHMSRKGSLPLGNDLKFFKKIQLFFEYRLFKKNIVNVKFHFAIHC